VSKKERDWYLCGFKDALEQTPYERSPSPEPPDLPNEYLPSEWKAYFKGWDDGIIEGTARILREVLPNGGCF